MADIIDFSTKNMSENKQNKINIKGMLQEIFKEADKIQDLLVCVKDKEGNRTLFHSDLNLEDKSVFIQLLQHDIFSDLSPTEDVHFEPDL